jgi:hypothetical protein
MSDSFKYELLTSSKLTALIMPYGLKLWCFPGIFQHSQYFYKNFKCNTKLVGYLIMLYWVQKFLEPNEIFITERFGEYYITAAYGFAWNLYVLLQIYQGHGKKFQGWWEWWFFSLSTCCLVLYPALSGLISHAEHVVTTTTVWIEYLDESMGI